MNFEQSPHESSPENNPVLERKAKLVEDLKSSSAGDSLSDDPTWTEMLRVWNSQDTDSKAHINWSDEEEKLVQSMAETGKPPLHQSIEEKPREEKAVEKTLVEQKAKLVEDLKSSSAGDSLSDDPTWAEMLRVWNSQDTDSKAHISWSDEEEKLVQSMAETGKYTM